MPVTPISGTAGRVQVEGATFSLIKSWRLEQVTAEVGIPHFESPTDALDRMWPEYLFGLSGATGTLEGYFDVDLSAPTDDVLTTGIEVTLQLMFSKTSSLGFEVEANVTAFGSGTAVENQPATFTLSFRVNGIVPLSAPV